MKKFISIILAMLLHVGCSQATTPTVNIMVPVTPGGPMNQIALALGQELNDNGISTITTFRPGANGDIATNATIKEKDNVILEVAIAHVLFSNIVAKRENIHTKSMVIFGPLVRSSLGFIISNKFSNDKKINTFAEFIDYARMHPVSCGTSAAHGGFELDRINQQYHTRFETIPYKGGGELRPNLIGGELECAYDSVGSHMPSYLHKDFKILAVATKTNGLVVPLINTVLPGYTFDNWFGFAVPVNSNLLKDPRIVKIITNFSKSKYLNPMFATYGFDPASPNKNINQLIDNDTKKYEKLGTQ